MIVGRELFRRNIAERADTFEPHDRVVNEARWLRAMDLIEETRRVAADIVAARWRYLTFWERVEFIIKGRIRADEAQHNKFYR